MPRKRDETEVETVLRNLIHAIDGVHWSEQYQAVWNLAFMHGLPYEGPSYSDELEAARKLMNGRLQ